MSDILREAFHELNMQDRQTNIKVGNSKKLTESAKPEQKDCYIVRYVKNGRFLAYDGGLVTADFKKADKYDTREEAEKVAEREGDNYEVVHCDRTTSKTIDEGCKCDEEAEVCPNCGKNPCECKEEECKDGECKDEECDEALIKNCPINLDLGIGGGNDVDVLSPDRTTTDEGIIGNLLNPGGALKKLITEDDEEEEEAEEAAEEETEEVAEEVPEEEAPAEEIADEEVAEIVDVEDEAEPAAITYGKFNGQRVYAFDISCDGMNGTVAIQVEDTDEGYNTAMAKVQELLGEVCAIAPAPVDEEYVAMIAGSDDWSVEVEDLAAEEPAEVAEEEPAEEAEEEVVEEEAAEEKPAEEVDEALDDEEEISDEDYIKNAEKFAAEIAKMEKAAARYYFRQYNFDNHKPEDEAEQLIYDALIAKLGDDAEEEITDDADIVDAIDEIRDGTYCSMSDSELEEDYWNNYGDCADDFEVCELPLPKLFVKDYLAIEAAAEENYGVDEIDSWRVTDGPAALNVCVVTKDGAEHLLCGENQGLDAEGGSWQFTDGTEE